MKIAKLIEELKGYAVLPVDEERTCDTVKTGDAQQEITGVGVTMFATPDVVREAAKRGINFLIVHEPLCYDHLDKTVPYAIGYEKRKLIEQLGITIFRFHDYAHSMEPDLIYEGQIRAMGLAGQMEKGDRFGVNRFVLEEEKTAAELASVLEKAWGVPHIRIAGCTDQKGRVISCCFGTPGHVVEELSRADFVITGELCEWMEAEAARDYAQLGYHKAILVTGHIGSEFAGMKLLAERLAAAHPTLSVSYLSCGGVYSYTDGAKEGLDG